MSLPFDLMEGFENSMKVQTFFVMDENLLLHRARAMQLLEHMKAAGKSWGVAVFASANAIRKYSMQELVELGVSWIWMGLESVNSKHAKLEGKDTHELTHELREHGIRVQGSTIIVLEHHTPANIAAESEHAISHETDFHQFMLYTPVPGTPLYREMKEQGRMLDSVDLADIHGQVKFNFKHAAISRDDSQRFLDFAFWHDFERNGPSLYHMCGTMLKGWKRYRTTPDPSVRERFEREVAKLRSDYIAALWAMEHQFRSINSTVGEQIQSLRKKVEKGFGVPTRFSSHILGPFMLWMARREERRLAAGKTYEPPTLVERTNWAST
jgi:hypothetical protein